MEERTWLIEIRKRKGLTQEQAAMLCETSRSGYSNVERGKGLSVEMAKKIAKALGFEWEVFFDEKRPKTNQKDKKSA